LETLPYWKWYGISGDIHFGNVFALVAIPLLLGWTILNVVILKVAVVIAVVEDLGYTKENVVPCCKVCNGMKMDTAVSKFREHIENIYSHWIKGIIC